MYCPYHACDVTAQTDGASAGMRKTVRRDMLNA